MIPLPYKLAIVGVALVGTFFVGREHGLQRYYDYRATVEAQMEQVKRENAARIDAMELAHQQAVQTWDAARAALAGRTVVRVRDNCGTGKVPVNPGTPGKPDDQAVELRPDPAIDLTVEQCQARVENAVIDAAQLVHLQHWAKQLHEASK